MSLDDRTWTVEGMVVVGSGASGRPRRIEVKSGGVFFAKSVADALNAHGRPVLTQAQQQILDAAMRSIAADGWFPSQVRLCAATGRSRPTVRAALKVLEEHGYIERRTTR